MHWTDGEDSYIAGLVHVGEEPGDGHVPDGLLEEHLLYGGRADGAERGQEQEQLAEATGLSRVPETQMSWVTNSRVPLVLADAAFLQLTHICDSSLPIAIVAPVQNCWETTVAYCLVNFYNECGCV